MDLKKMFSTENKTQLDQKNAAVSRNTLKDDRGRAQTAALVFLLLAFVAVGMAYSLSSSSLPTGLVAAVDDLPNETDNIKNSTMDDVSVEPEINSSGSSSTPPYERPPPIEITENETREQEEPPETNETEQSPPGIPPVQNETIPGANGTIPEEPENDTTPPEPPSDTVVNVEIQMPPKLTRGEAIEVKAIATSNDAKNVVLTWILPPGFTIAVGEKQKECGDLSQGTCESIIQLETTLSTSLGESEIRVDVSYE